MWRLVWALTRGYRLRPWRSPYLRWRIETYSGMRADTMSSGDVLRFLWKHKSDLIRFLGWADRMAATADRR